MTELEIHQAAYLAVVQRVVNQRDEAIALLLEARKALEYTAVERDWASSERILAEIEALVKRRDEAR
jgi:hypothetical protein